MQKREKSKSGLLSRITSIVILLSLLVSSLCAANFDRMGKAEVFLRSVYPDVFARVGQYRAEFTDSDPTMMNRTSELRFNIAQLPAKSALSHASAMPTSSPAPIALPDVGSPSAQALESTDKKQSRLNSTAGNCPSNPERCAISGEIMFTPEGKVRRFSAFGESITSKYQAWVYESEMNKESLTDEEINQRLIAEGAKYPPNGLERFRQQLPLKVLNELTACKLNPQSTIFEGRKQTFRDYVNGRFVPRKGHVLWEVLGTRIGATEKGEVCMAEFEPFGGNLRAIW